MLVAVVDTNVLVAGLLSGNPRSASREVIDRYHAGEFRVALSPAILHEIATVLSLPELRSVHRLSNEEIRRFREMLQLGSRVFSGTVDVPASMTRDVSDTKWVGLAIEANADYLVTLDRRHLQRLKKIEQTQIVTPRAFLRALDAV